MTLHLLEQYSAKTIIFHDFHKIYYTRVLHLLVLLLQIELRNSMPASSYQQQKLRVCEVCGAYLGIHDNDRRLADHFGGKLHLGFITIREKLEQLKVSRLHTLSTHISIINI